ncbi:hypothetical protein ACIQ9E_06175 [Streptomyces sp. NPDC094448]|uniref:hypothetical protein n=1 Tax=Streptomyces sp. NPDC094448 TaxID=3366063 RepID=UPI003828C5E5
MTEILRPAMPDRHTAVHLEAVQPEMFPTPRVDPWTRPWTTPGQEEAQALLLAREQALRARTVPDGPQPPRRLYVAPQGIVLVRPVAVRTARPGPGWGWLR